MAPDSVLLGLSNPPHTAITFLSQRLAKQSVRERNRHLTQLARSVQRALGIEDKCKWRARQSLQAADYFLHDEGQGQTNRATDGVRACLDLLTQIPLVEVNPHWYTLVRSLDKFGVMRVENNEVHSLQWRARERCVLPFERRRSIAELTENGRIQRCDYERRSPLTESGCAACGLEYGIDQRVEVSALHVSEE